MTAARMSPNTPLLAKAEQALSRHQWFEAERLALKALELARAAREFDEMARITLPLQETRRQRMQVAAWKDWRTPRAWSQRDELSSGIRKVSSRSPQHDLVDSWRA